MLERISWSTYLTVIGVMLAIYYLLLFVLLFQKGFSLKRRGRTDARSFTIQEPAGNPQPNLFGFEEGAKENAGNPGKQQMLADDNILMPFVHDLIQELKAFIIDISERSYVKEEIIMGIQVIIRNYEKLEGSPYQKSINDFIKSECEERCSIHLSEEDIKRIWKG